MPFTFPSHPGLILPLWVYRPAWFDGVAMGVASVLPDLLDATIEIPTGVHDRNFAHSLLGLVTAVVPLAVLIVWVLDLAIRREHRRLLALASPAPESPLSPAFLRRAAWVRRLGTRRFLFGRVLASVAVGAFSHLLFDAVTHDRFDWLLPWTRPEIAPAALEGTWVTVWVRGMPRDEVKLGFFGMMWVALSGLGALLFVWVAWVAARRRVWR